MSTPISAPPVRTELVSSASLGGGVPSYPWTRWFQEVQQKALTFANAPATASAAGTAGQVAFDSGFFYVCIAKNTWKRAAISTW